MNGPRRTCFHALRAWEEEGAPFADDILHACHDRTPLAARDRALLTELFYGILRNLSRLDFMLARLTPRKIDRATRCLLRLGLYQLFDLRVPPHAAVNETVALAGRARTFVNALLRLADRERERLHEELAAAPAPVRFSHPEYLWARWEARYGPAATAELGAWNNRPAELFVRANRLKVTAGELLATVPTAEPVPGREDMLRVASIPPSWFVAGLCYIQDPSTLLACDLLDPRPGETVLDACAAPGGKTSRLAELMENGGCLVACDSRPDRVARLRGNLDRLGVANVKVVAHDWLAGPPPFAPATFDRILVDVPCSNTGVFRRRVDARWRLAPDDLHRLPDLQLALMAAVLPLLKPGGVIVYSTCSIEPEENEGLIERLRERTPALDLIESRQLIPMVDGVDGAYAAKLMAR